MKLFTNKISRFFMIFAVLFIACETEETLIITQPDAAFELQQPSISNIILNFGLDNNPAVTVSWNDEVTGSSTYDVQMALNETFDTPTMLGTSATNSFTIGVSELNMAINAAEPSNFTDVPVYIRVNAGASVSNTILFLVTAYAENAAEITSPAMGDAFVLELANTNDDALTATWDDAALTGSDTINYTLEAALAGTDFANTVLVGSASNEATVAINTGDLNAAILGLGVLADTATDIDLRLVSETINSSGNALSRTSETVTISVTPYSVSFPYLYFVGDATTPGWDNNNNNTAVFRSQDTPNSYHFTGYFNSGGFKLLEMKGSWHPQWGDRNASGTLGVSNDDGSNEAGTFGVAAAGYYTITMASLSEGSAYSMTPFDASAAPTYNKIGLIGQAIGGWGDTDEVDLTQDPNNPHLWYALAVNFTNGEQFLIRPNDDWDNGVWRHTGSDELFGQANLSGGGENFPHNAPTGAYDVWFNDLDGSYVIIPN